ncbi:DUF4432 family protein [Bogoriella caseilytica]|uniref:Galactose mutarotase-like enzyme n=1 Tax=Bogoriella caseilytica TaxID=56055 RepID=A0A3N2BGV4_9MICO|nr:DUF4432 family protein [Bogoriella caseilytica]ROR74491.1 galactose mutarotase-like enzyme [Bogoriella caseilytica]
MAITLRSADLELTLTPERGADIVSLCDLATGVQVLAVSPTGDVTSGPLSAGGSIVAWTSGYPGGWQLLVPNAGPERLHDGVVQGYHGEASLARWRVESQRDNAARLSTSLVTAPLRLVRDVVVTGARVIVTDAVTNLSPEPCSFRLAQHPAFGDEFLDEHSYVTSRARTLITDADAPGTLTGADAVGAPAELLPAGPVNGSVALPGPGSGEALFGALTGFAPSDDGSTSATFHSPTRGFGMRLTWDPSVYPYAWFWIEAHAHSGWPWFKRLFAAAVEPCNVLPGEGATPDGRQRGGPGATLDGGATLTSVVRLDRVPA